MTALLVALGAAVGATCRFLAGHVLDRDLPLGTLMVNLAGSFLMGWLSSAALTGDALALWGTGFCGGMTTYSGFAVHTVGLGLRRGTAYALLTVAGAVGACALGFALGA